MDCDVVIASPVTLEYRCSLAAEAKPSPILCAGGQGHGRIAINGGHLDLRAQQGLGQRPGHFAQDIVPLAGKIGMRSHPYDDVQIPRRATVPPWLAFARHPYFRTRVYARRDFDLPAFHAAIAPRHLHVRRGASYGFFETDFD